MSAAPAKLGGPIEATLDITIAELQVTLAPRFGAVARLPTIHSALHRIGLRQGKTKKVPEGGPSRSAAMSPPAPAQARLGLSMDPGRFILLHETGSATSMARRYGHSPRGPRLIAAVPQGRAYLEQFLAPALGAAGARTCTMPPCSPDLGPIEQLFARFKTPLRKAAARVGRARTGGRPPARRRAAAPMRQIPQPLRLWFQ